MPKTRVIKWFHGSQYYTLPLHPKSHEKWRFYMGTPKRRFPRVTVLYHSIWRATISQLKSRALFWAQKPPFKKHQKNIILWCFRNPFHHIGPVSTNRELRRSCFLWFLQKIWCSLSTHGFEMFWWRVYKCIRSWRLEIPAIYTKDENYPIIFYRGLKNIPMVGFYINSNHQIFAFAV